MISSLTLSVLMGHFLASISSIIFDQGFAVLCFIPIPVAIAAISFHFYFPDTPAYFLKKNDEKVRMKLMLIEYMLISEFISERTRISMFL